MTTLQDLAEQHGVATSWYDIAGQRHEVPATTLEAVLQGLGVDPAAGLASDVRPPQLATPEGPVVVPELPVGAAYTVELDDGTRREGRALEGAGGGALGAGLPMGLHRLVWDDGARHLLVAPERCLLPHELGCARAFGVGAQLYGLRSRRPSAIGDFGDLRAAARLAGEAGGDLFGLSPLHALFMADAHARSPYSPSHRAFVNPLYIDVPWAADMLGLEPPAVASIGPELLDYPELAVTKQAALEALFKTFRGKSDLAELAAFRTVGGIALERHCRFEALHEASLAADPDRWAFWTWPTGWRDPESAGVADFARKHDDRVTYFAFLQWLADQQLEATQAAARDSGMRLGLYRDLAVGVNPAGSMAWSTPGLALPGLAVGAPPDPLGPDGQNWGLAPFAPTKLAALGYRPLLDDLEMNARHAGAIRIDHVLGFERQFWIPDGAPAHEGTYVRFPFEVLARICALVSHRQRCVVVGEDLGTVPEGFRERLHGAGMLSCRVLWFERDGDRYKTPGEYPQQALASVSTHDLPTVRGFMAGKDLDWRADLGGHNADRRKSAHASRDADATSLTDAVRAVGIEDEPFAVALHRYLATTASALALLQLEDLADTLEQPNLPGTVDEHPNWRRRLPVPVEDLFETPLTRAILAAVRDARPRD